MMGRHGSSERGPERRKNAPVLTPWVARLVTVTAIATVSSSAGAHPNRAYADQLMADGDYYRAISVFKELAFYELDPRTRAELQYQIGRAYRLGQRYELAAEALTEVMQSAHSNEALRGHAAHQLGLAHLGMRSAHQAVLAFESGRSADTAGVTDLFLGFVELEAGNAVRARACFDSARRAREPRVAAMALELQHAAVAYERASSRSPVAAGALSLVLPGAGQAYTGHWVDAMQAFAFVGSFAFMTYVGYRYESDRGGPYVLTGMGSTITGVFHVANVVGAARSAEYYNLRHKQLLIDAARERVLEFDF